MKRQIIDRLIKLLIVAENNVVLSFSEEECEGNAPLIEQKEKAIKEATDLREEILWLQKLEA